MSFNSLRKQRKILFLDRDDTIIKDYGYLNDPKKVLILDGVLDALKMFRDQGYEFIVTTNQSGLTRGIVDIENLNLIHQKIQYEFNQAGLRILDFYSAPYSHEHKRRKPNFGLTYNAMLDYGVDIKNSIFAGDKWRDLHIGFKLGAKTILVNEAKDQRILFGGFVPDLCLPSWTDLTLSVLNSFLKGNVQNLSSIGFFHGKTFRIHRSSSTSSHHFKNN